MKFLVLLLALPLGSCWSPASHLSQVKTRNSIYRPRYPTSLQILPEDSMNGNDESTITSGSVKSTTVSQACTAFIEDNKAEQDAMLKRDRKIWIMPVVVAALSYTLFPQTIAVFHQILEIVSFQQYTGELSEDIRPLINGPVTLTISILFGSLVSMTISTLYQRQTDIHRTGIDTMNECRHIQYLAEALPEPERTQVRTMVASFSIRQLRSFFRGDLFKPEQRRQLDLAPVLVILHQVSRRGETDPYMGELYGCISAIKSIRADFTAAYQKNFTPAHYLNLLIQATSLLMIYLWETDDVGLLEAHPFELRVAWAMLASTIASLIAIIIDLNTPISNIITMVRKHEVDMEELIAFSLAKDLDWRIEETVPAFVAASRGTNATSVSLPR